MKIPFTLEAWLKDTSQKVVDENGRPVRIICTDADGLYPIIGLVDNKTPLPCGKDGRPPYIGGGGGTLFLVTPEPELSEFEKRLSDVVGYAISLSVAEPKKPTCDFVKEYAAELLALAEKEIAKGHEHDVYIPEDTYYEQLAKQWEDGYDKGKAKALEDLPRWKKDESFETEGSFMGVKGREFFVVKDGYSISVAELIEKLPGFKED